MNVLSRSRSRVHSVAMHVLERLTSEPIEPRIIIIT